METKVVYVLTSNPQDIYLEQFYVSVLSLRKRNKDCEVNLFIDNLTANTLVGFREKMSSVADKIHTITFDPCISNQEKSRLLKTSVRNYIDGDFIFIDCDTIIIKPIDEIDSFNMEMAACFDSHSEFIANPYRKGCLEHGRLLNWPIEDEEEYFNSGIIFVKDTPMTRKFYKLWNTNWKEGAKIGVKMDQPSFAKTNYELNHFVQRLPDDWNCELKHGITCFNSAKIIHYLCTNINRAGDNQIFLLHNRSVFDKLKTEEKLPLEIEKCIENWNLGLQSPTQIISGFDLKLHHSLSYIVLKKLFNTKFFSIIESLLSFANKLKNKI